MKPFEVCSIIAFFLSMLSIDGFSQVTYEEGYIIDNENNKIECLIENKDWKDNPTKFNYKRTADAESLTADISHVNEFRIGNSAKYIRASVRIDRSSSMVKELTEERNPVLKEEMLFLNVLVEGPATLYMYEDKNLRRFFYRVKDSEIEPLIYKKYIADDMVAENTTFLGQLNYALNCDEAAAANLATLRYTEGDLRGYFLSFNNCVGEESVVFKDKSENNFNLKITPGVNYSSFAIDGYEGKLLGVTDRKPYFRLGIEAEMVLPFHKNKWSIIIEPTYQYFKAEGSNEGRSHVETFTIDYKYVDIPVGVRHYFFLSKKSRVFVNASLVLNFSLDPANVELIYPWKSEVIDFESFHNFAIGAGLLHNRISTELRYFTNKNLTWKQTAYLSSYNNMSLIFGYRIF